MHKWLPETEIHGVDLIKDTRKKFLQINYTRSWDYSHTHKRGNPPPPPQRYKKNGFTGRDTIASKGNQVSLQLSSSPSSLPTACRALKLKMMRWYAKYKDDREKRDKLTKVNNKERTEGNLANCICLLQYCCDFDVGNRSRCNSWLFWHGAP